jgi:hypothetical protein
MPDRRCVLDSLFSMVNPPGVSGDSDPWEGLGSGHVGGIQDAARLRVLLEAAGIRRVLLDPDLSSCPGRWEMDDLRRLAAQQERGVLR